MESPTAPLMVSQDGAPKVPSKKKPGKPTVPTKMEKEADLVMGTNNSSIVSKRSVELRYFPKYEFFRPFVKKPQRRAPLINRGYWLRMHAIAETVRQFLQSPDTRPKFVLNLGCGYDPLAFQLLKTEKSICDNATFVDIDYEKLMGIKTSVIQQTEELKSTLGDIKVYPDPNPVLLRASHYVAVGCDLKNLKKLEEALNEVLGLSPVSVLCIAEVSLTYMDVQSADALISWFPTLGKDIQFCVLEQYFPDGPDHPFASTMMKHFQKLQAPLHSIHKYPTMPLQEQRFTSQGWRYASARSLWDIWNDDSFLSKSQRMGLDSIEPFDEWEEFALFASHYSVVTASTVERESSPKSNGIEAHSDLPKASLKLVSHRPASFRGHRRFAAAVPDSDRSIGVHGGLGSQSRLLSTDIYYRGEEGTQPAGTLPAHQISARMCHTITALRDGGCLLVGGRASPNAGLDDCWIRKDNVWKPTHSLPCTRFRHSAVRVQVDDAEGVLVYGGKNSKGDILDGWLLWNERKGWQTVKVAGKPDIASRFGSQMVAVDSSSGYLFGGMSPDGVVFNDFWKWCLEIGEDGIAIIQLTDLSQRLRNATNIANYLAGRFGATANVISNKLLVIGGIGVRGVLPEKMEILCLDIAELGRNEWSSSVIQAIDAHYESPALRPLLAGHVSGTVDSSVIVASGGVVCFSFGTFWNNYIWQICDASVETPEEWKYFQVAEKRSTKLADASATKLANEPSKPNEIKSIPRVTIQTAADFESIMSQAKPVVITGLNIGTCTEKWSKEYLVETLGSDRKVVVHEAQTDHMNFQRKNFSYKTKEFGTFMGEIHQGSRQYLRSISSDQPAKKAACFEQDFPEIKDDFVLPDQLSFVRDSIHSSPLRISGPVTMWLHYDVMANVYCQICGQKKLVLYPPSDVEHLQLPPGASSSTLDIFATDNNIRTGQIVSVPHTSPHEATLAPGEMLFIPPLWLHAATPVDGVSIAVNIFFRNLEKGYAAGRDVYANRDLEAYEKGRNEVEKIVRSFDGVPPDIARFYLVDDAIPLSVQGLLIYAHAKIDPRRNFIKNIGTSYKISNGNSPGPTTINSTLRDSSPVSPALSLNVRPRTPTSIPNKHIPVCPPGSAPSAISPVEQTGVSLTSLLYPPDRFKKLFSSPPVYSINGATLVAALDHLATQPLPDPKQVFPWLHGLHPFNGVQSAFFVNRKRSLRRIPRCFRSLTLVSLDGDLTKSRLRGAVSLDEILDTSGTEFIDADPIYGFSVRNFHIQTAKLAPLSDIVIYAERSADQLHLFDAARKVAIAQQNWRMKHDPAQETPLFNTFILSDSFEEIGQRYPDLVAIDSQGQITGKVMDFFQWERNEMCSMSKTSEISKNVWLGPSPDILMSSDGQDVMDTTQFDLTIEAIDLAPIPGPRYLDGVSKSLANEEWAEGVTMQFPSSGSIVPQLEANRDVEDFVNTVRWLYYLANPEDNGSDIEELDDIPMEDSPKSYKIFIHCADGYTESSLLAIAYFMFAEGLPLDQAWIRLHREKGRNFFAYPSDVVFLRSIQQQLLEQSPAAARLNLDALCEPAWLRKMDGSLPSRILPYMYLGNLAHANNPELLRELGIKRVLSIGEPVSWSEKEIESWGEDNLMFIGQVQDNGIDPLTQEFENCLSFIEKGKADRSATLVHCRVGVSRSATICIAEVMSSLKLSFPRAYCFVRARRLNVIIQPHLRFVYELLKWDELQQQKRREPLRRELEWASIAREIALMNKPYSRQQ